VREGGGEEEMIDDERERGARERRWGKASSHTMNI
jgi:hypothetical protein